MAPASPTPTPAPRFKSMPAILCPARDCSRSQGPAVLWQRAWNVFACSAPAHPSSHASWVFLLAQLQVSISNVKSPNSSRQDPTTDCPFKHQSRPSVRGSCGLCVLVGGPHECLAPEDFPLGMGQQERTGMPFFPAVSRYQSAGIWKLSAHMKMFQARSTFTWSRIQSQANATSLFQRPSHVLPPSHGGEQHIATHPRDNPKASGATSDTGILYYVLWITDFLCNLLGISFCFCVWFVYSSTLYRSSRFFRSRLFYRRHVLFILLRWFYAGFRVKCM